MKKRWVLLLLLTAALFISCPEASASIMNGIWRIDSGSLFVEERVYGDKWAGYLGDAEPDEFSIRVVERVKDLYTMVINNGHGIDLLWTLTDYPPGDDGPIGGNLFDMNYLVKNSDTEYHSSYSEDGVTYYRSVVLLDSYTLKLVRTEDEDTVYRRYEYILDRVGWDIDAEPDDNSSGCNAGFGAFVAMALILPAIMAARRIKQPRVRN